MARVSKVLGNLRQMFGIQRQSYGNSTMPIRINHTATFYRNRAIQKLQYKDKNARGEDPERIRIKS